MGAVLTGISIACIAGGVVLLVIQVQRRPAEPGPGPSGNGSEPAGRAEPRPARPDPARPASSRGEVAKRRRILAALLVAMVATLAAALVVRERWLLGAHLFVDDAFLGYVAWLARGAETRARTPEPAVEMTPIGRVSTGGADGADGSDGSDGGGADRSENAEENLEAQVTDARA